MEFNFQDYIKETEEKHRRDFDIIIHYWGVKNYKFPSKAAANSDLVRCLKAAKILGEYSNDRIMDVMVWLEKNADFPWKLETCLKYINEDLSKLRTRK